MPLTVFFKSEISPLQPTSICLERSPSATAFVTFAIDLTWDVRFAARRLTTPVSSRHVPSTSSTNACPPSLPYACVSHRSDYVARTSHTARPTKAVRMCANEKKHVPFHTDFLTYTSYFRCELSEFVDLQIMKMRSENPSYAITGGYKKSLSPLL